MRLAIRPLLVSLILLLMANVLLLSSQSSWASEPYIYKERTQQLQSMIKKMMLDSELPITRNFVLQSKVIKTEEMNAHTNGEYMVFTHGLWDALERDDARAFVVGHELGHVTNDHLSSGRKWRNGILITGGAVLMGGADSPINPGRLVANKFNRSFETEADFSAITYMEKSGYSKHAALEVMEVLMETRGSGKKMEWLSSHPLTPTRIHNLVKFFELDATKATLWQPKMFPTVQEAVKADTDLNAVQFHKSGEPIEGRNRNMEDYKSD
jgi:Zn-dependent protease with chaperone function